MSQVNTIVKGFQTLQGTVQYDYESLKNKPDIEGKIQTALEEYKVDVDTTLKNAGEAADAKATGEKIAQAISNANAYTDKQLGSFKVNVDTTLKKEGEAADAKAVGDALAKKQPVGNYALQSAVDEIGSLVGDIAVSTQIQEAVAQKTQVQIIIWEDDD